MAIVHIVLVHWKEDTEPATVESVRDAVRSMEGVLPGVVTLTEGPSVSPEGLESGFDYALAIEFVDADARDVYLTHAAHLPVAAALQTHSRDIVVFDILRS